MRNKKSRAARSAAVVFAVVGVAGLSMAATSQLEMTWNGVFPAGAVVVTGDCQGGKGIRTGFEAPVSTPDGTPPAATGTLRFSGVDGSCAGLHYRVDYRTGASSDWLSLEEDGKVLLDDGVLAVGLDGVDPQGITQVELTFLN